MKPCFRIIIALLSVFAASSHGDARDANRHDWEYIDYDSWTNGPYFSFSVGYGEKARGLRLDIHGIDWDFAETNRIKLRVHRRNSDPLPPTEALLPAAGTGSHGFTDYDSIIRFPWPTNNLDESWIEAQIGTNRFWFEVPYGFDRNPKDPLLAAVKLGAPKVPATVHFNPSDHIEKWKRIHYDVGAIQNQWRLNLEISNDRDGWFDVILYRDDVKVGESIYLWKMHSPQTQLHLIDWKGHVTEGVCTTIHMHEDGMRRSDVYRIYDDRPDKERYWGKLEIAVDDRKYQLTVPSSVFKLNHRHYDSR